MKLYFYTSLNTAKAIIESSSLALSPPATFNDPFDCLPLWDKDDLNKAINILNGYMIDVSFFETFAAKTKDSKKISQKVVSNIIAFQYKILRKASLKFKDPYNPFYTVDRFTKMLDFLIKCSKNPNELIEVKDKFASGISDLLVQEEIKLRQLFEIRDSIYVGCLSKNNNSILMWSYYGDKHRGACIEIDIDEDKSHLFKVQYKKERPQIQSEKVIREYCGRLFAKMENELISKDEVIINLLAMPYITKSLEWEHEQEYRLIFTEKELQEKDYDKRRCDDNIERHLYPISNVNKIFLGANTSEEDKKELKLFCQSLDKNIDFETMMISNSEYFITPKIPI